MPRKPFDLNDLIKTLRSVRRNHVAGVGEMDKLIGAFERMAKKADNQPSSKSRQTKAGQGKAKKRGKPAAGKGQKAGAVKLKAKRKGQVAASAKSGSRARHELTGDEFIIRYILKKGSATTSEIRQHWTKQGRKGKAENNLTGLVKKGKLMRDPTPGQIGSTYSLAPSIAAQATP